MSGKIDQALATQGAALVLRSKRQQLIASNIANADTPGYRARDIDFASALRSATSGVAAGSPTAIARASQPVELAADRNTVDMDRERARFADNTVRYEAALQFLNGQISTLLSAIKG